jgi:glycosyltransferase involved in cell wall biosynthesis
MADVNAMVSEQRIGQRTIRVTLSAAFGGGVFYYAEQLDKRGYLHHWLTSLRSAVRMRVGREKIRVNLLPEVLARLRRRLPWLGNVVPDGYLKAEVFDRWAARQLTDCDVVVAVADSALRTLRRAKQLGAVAIVESGSAHILCQKRLLSEEHDRFGHAPFRMDEWRVRNELAEYEEADFIAVASTFARESFLAHGVPAGKLICVPMGVDLDYFRPLPKGDEVFRIVAMAGLRKGCQYLLEAIRQMRLPRHEVVLLGAMSAELGPVLREYRGLYRYIGQVRHRDLYRHYAGGSVFVLPSVEDGWGLMVNEAMACGLPIICSTNTGARDMIRDGIDGFIVPTRDVEALKDRLLYLYSHEQERQAMGRSALERVREFTWDRYGDRIASEYGRVVTTARRGQ